MNEKIFRKGFNGIIKDVDTKTGTVTGYFSSFNHKDSDGDIILPGAFAKTIAENGPVGKNRIYHLLQHRSTDILGLPKVLKEDEFGLYFENTISQTSWGKDAIILYQDGVLKEHSIGFNIVLSERDNDTSTTFIKEIKLWEGSAVTWGANENTPTVSAKTAEGKAELIEQLQRIEKAIQTGGFRDETFRMLEYELKYIKQALTPEEPREPQEMVNKFYESFLKNIK